jgi:hypothetical protein
MSVIVTTPINGRTDDLNELSFPAPGGKLNRLPAASAPEQRILAVEFRSPDGRSWHAIGAAQRSRRRSTGHGKLLRRRDLAPGQRNDLDGD